MSQFFQIHPENPQARLVRQAVDIIRQGGVDGLRISAVLYEPQGWYGYEPMLPCMQC